MGSYSSMWVTVALFPFDSKFLDFKARVNTANWTICLLLWGGEIHYYKVYKPLFFIYQICTLQYFTRNKGYGLKSWVVLHLELHSNIWWENWSFYFNFSSLLGDLLFGLSAYFSCSIAFKISFINANALFTIRIHLINAGGFKWDILGVQLIPACFLLHFSSIQDILDGIIFIEIQCWPDLGRLDLHDLAWMFNAIIMYV